MLVVHEHLWRTCSLTSVRSADGGFVRIARPQSGVQCGTPFREHPLLGHMRVGFRKKVIQTQPRMVYRSVLWPQCIPQGTRSSTTHQNEDLILPPSFVACGGKHGFSEDRVLCKFYGSCVVCLGVTDIAISVHRRRRCSARPRRRCSRSSF